MAAQQYKVLQSAIAWAAEVLVVLSIIPMGPTPNTAGPVAAVPTPAMPTLQEPVVQASSAPARVAAVLTGHHGRQDGAALTAHIRRAAVGRLTLEKLAVLELHGLGRAETAVAAVLGVIPRG